MTQHALVAPSGLHLTIVCAASLLLQYMAPEAPRTEEQREGDAAHWHALQYAQGNKLPLGAKFKSGGEEWEVTADMLHGSQLWAYHTCRGATGRYEDPVSMPQIHGQCWGTPDYWQSRAPEAIFVKDYKYGHRYVDVFENWQLIAYAIGVCHRLGITDLTQVIVLVIIQPRCYRAEGPVKEWRTTLGQLLTLYVPRIIAQLEVAMVPNPKATTGAHCIDCKARHLCSTLQRGAMHVVEFTGVGEAVELPNDALGVEARILLDAHAVLTARLEGLKAQIEALQRSGKDVPYWAMQPGRSLLKWNDNVTGDDVAMLGMAAGVETMHPPKPKTPTQCRDLGVDEKVIDAYATRQPAGMSLKPLSTTQARKVFGKNV